MAGFDDGSGSVMAKMMALFAPPGRDSKRGDNPFLNPRPVELHPYFKRPGKGHNHNSCDACGEGGDLICCDNCPASFHFSCHCPPLEEEDIPKGDWVCLRCYVRDSRRNEAILAANNGTTTVNPNGASSEASTESEESQTPTGQSKGSRARSLRGNSSKKQVDAVLKAEKEKTIKKYKLKYDKYLKPIPSTNSPFDILITAAQAVNAEEFKLPKELECKEALPNSWKWSDERCEDTSRYPKICAGCRKTSRNMPAIMCDFCPSVYHLDCLDPPLCDIPKDRWMCPNHVENFVDSTLLTSTSLSERMKLWGKFAKNKVDPETVKIDFLRKARSGKLFQRSRVKTPLLNRVKVPQFVKDQYKQPLPGYAQDLNIAPSINTSSRDGSQDEFIAQMISLQTSVLRDQNKELLETEDQGSKTERERLRRKKRTFKAATNGLESVEAKPDPESGDKTASTVDSDTIDDADTLSNCSVDFTSDSDDGLFLSEELHQELNEYIAKNKDRCIKSLSPTLKDYLALQKIKEYFPEKLANVDTEVQARAALAPINISKLPALMRYRTLNIGVGAHNDLDLAKYGHCNFVSPKHASIYFDQYTQVYELINYSEHGTIVDNVVYALDLKPLVAAKVNRGNHLATMSRSEEARNCHCDTSIAKMLTQAQGTENSAVLHHGSYLRIGCLQFVFSIMEYQEAPEKIRKIAQDPKSGDDMSKEVNDEEKAKEECVEKTEKVEDVKPANDDCKNDEKQSNE